MNAERAMSEVLALDESEPATAPRPVMRAVILIVNAAAFVLFAAVVVHWAWQWLGPAPVVIARAEPAHPADTIIASGLFGPRGAPGASASSVATAPALGDARLLGVLAEPGGKGVAIFRLSSGTRVVAVGSDIAPGTTLVAVQPDGVTVRDGAGERSWLLRGDASPRGPGAAAPAGAVAPRREAQLASAGVKSPCRPPAGFHGQVVQLNVELLDGLIAQPESWRAMLEPVSGALAIRDAGGYAAMLGLKAGDRVEQANGIALAVPDDVVRAVLKPLRANQPVRLSGRRGNEARELWLVNVSCIA